MYIKPPCQCAALRSKAWFQSSTSSTAFLKCSPWVSEPCGPVLTLCHPGKNVTSTASGIMTFVSAGQFSAIMSSCANNVSTVLVIAISASAIFIIEIYQRSHKENHIVNMVPLRSDWLTRSVAYCFFSKSNHSCIWVFRSARGSPFSNSIVAALLSLVVFRKVLFNRVLSTTGPLCPLPHKSPNDLAKLS